MKSLSIQCNTIPEETAHHYYNKEQEGSTKQQRIPRSNRQ